MSEEDRKKVDIKSYIRYFRNFHIFLGISFLVIGLLLQFLLGNIAAGIFLVAYPILAYIYFALSSSGFSKGSSPKSYFAAGIILSSILLLMILLFIIGFKEDKLVFRQDEIKITGIYGEKIPFAEIQSIRLIEQLPVIKSRTNGFALGAVRKGYFKTSQGEKVKLILNSTQKPYLLLIKKNAQKIYYSSKNKANQEIYNELNKSLGAD